MCHLSGHSNKIKKRPLTQKSIAGTKTRVAWCSGGRYQNKSGLVEWYMICGCLVGATVCMCVSVCLCVHRCVCIWCVVAGGGVRVWGVGWRGGIRVWGVGWRDGIRMWGVGCGVEGHYKWGAVGFRVLGF